MARYIVIDNDSGYIFGDSADLDGRIFNGSALEYVEALDRSIGNYGRDYKELPFSAYRDGKSGYRVYCADVGGSDAVVTVWDGQDQGTIDAVEQDCTPDCFITYRAMDW